MILFSTKFAIAKDFTQDVLLDMLREWISESNNYSIPFQYKDEPDYSAQSDDGCQRLALYRDTDCLAFQLQVLDEKSLFINTYILRSDMNVMFIRLEKEMKEGTISFEKTWNLPRLMRQIFWDEYGGDDNGIQTDDKPTLLRKRDIQHVCDIASGKATHINPIVYVSPYQDSGKYSINYSKLARDLVGMAHVLVEGSPVVSNKIHELVEHHPYNGGVGIFLPNGDYQPLRAIRNKDIPITQCIMQCVRDVVSSVIPGEEFSFQRIRLHHALAQYKDNDELMSIYDELLTEKENKLDGMEKEMDRLRSDLSNAQLKVQSLSDALNNKKTSGDGITLAVTERELYQGEISDFILRCIQHELACMPDDLTRKRSVMSDILEHNAITGKSDAIRDEMRAILRSGAGMTEKISALERLGFTASLEGKHYKLYFNGDTRYMGTLSNTPSDYRSVDNFVSNYSKLLF